MALKGNLKIWKVRESGKFKEQQVTYPNNYPDSELAGQTVTSQEPVLEEYIDQEINDAYVIIRMAAIHLEDYDRIVTDESGNVIETDVPRGETKNGHRFYFQYHVYTSKEARQDKFFKPELQLDIAELVFVDDLSLDNMNIIEYCYNYLKTKKGFDTLIKD